MGFTTAEALKLTFKVQAGGVIDAASGAQWYESKFPFNPSINAWVTFFLFFLFLYTTRFTVRHCFASPMSTLPDCKIR